MNGFQGPTSKEILLDAVTKIAGEHVLDTIKPSSEVIVVDPPPAAAAPADDSSEGGSTTGSDSDSDFVPTCATQAPMPTPLQNGPSDIMVALGDNCPRWAPGSVIRWAAWAQGFKTPEDAWYAAKHLNLAAQKWNELDIGVTFEWVPLAKDATFVLCHGGSYGGHLAQAFFPNADDLNFLRVYNAAFSIKTFKDNMWKIFTHELGHVLGLRHEFAMDIIQGGKETREKERAYQIGPRDLSSVMTYGSRPPEIQQSDVDSTREFYALRGDALGNPPKVGRAVVIDYTPM